MVGEEVVISSAAKTGDFVAVLAAFLVIGLMATFVWALKTIIDNNQCFNTKILLSMDKVVDGIKEYKTTTCAELDKHDVQAKAILKSVEHIETTLENRPCINGARTK